MEGFFGMILKGQIVFISLYFVIIMFVTKILSDSYQSNECIVKNVTQNNSYHVYCSVIVNNEVERHH